MILRSFVLLGRYFWPFKMFSKAKLLVRKLQTQLAPILRCSAGHMCPAGRTLPRPALKYTYTILLYLSYPSTLSLIFSLTLSPNLCITLKHTHYISNTDRHTQAHSLSLSLAGSYTHTHTNAHSLICNLKWMKVEGKEILENMIRMIKIQTLWQISQAYRFPIIVLRSRKSSVRKFISFEIIKKY